jgi:hypothetical protein
MNELQGQWNTYWTGAAWESESSAAIWAFTEKVVMPMLMGSLNGTNGTAS